MAFTGLKTTERENLRDHLDILATNHAVLLKSKRDALQAFRVLCSWGLALSEGAPNLQAWLRFAELTALLPCSAKQRLAPTDTFDDEAATSIAASVAGASPAEAAVMVQRLKSQRRRDAVEATSTIMPPWRESINVTVGKFNPQLSTVGTGLAKRTLHSAFAVANMMAALAPLNVDEVPRRMIEGSDPIANMNCIDKAFAEEAFLYAARGADRLTFHTFIVLEYCLAAKRYSHNYEDDPKDAVRRLHAEYFRNAILESSPEDFAAINSRSPIQRYPDVDLVLHMYNKVILSVFELFAGPIATTIPVDDILQLARAVGCHRAPHMSDAAVKLAVCAALRCKLSAMPAQVDYDQFVDSLCFIGWYLYSYEPHKTLWPTVAARLYEFFASWEAWYQQTLSKSMQEVLVPLPPGPVVVTGFSVSTVNARNSHVIEVYGRNFGNSGMFFRFGRLITAAPRCSDALARVHVPPASVDQFTVRLRADGDDFVVQLIHFCNVAVTGSRDGFVFSDPCPTRFVYEDPYPEVAMALFQPKLLRIFQNYCRQGNEGNVDTGGVLLMKEAQWKRVLGEFHLVRSSNGEIPLDPSPEVQASEEYQREMAALSTDDLKRLHDERAVGKLFAEYSTVASGRVAATLGGDFDDDDRSPATKLRTLVFDRFVRALVHAVVINRGHDITSGMRVLLSSDKWVGRELLDDIPAAHKGGLALRIRRAANAFHLTKVIEHMSHNNSPRNEVWSVPALRRELQGIPLGRWENEHDHDRLTLEFLARQHEIEEIAIGHMRNTLTVPTISADEDSRVHGPAVDPISDPPPPRHQLADVDASSLIPGLHAEAVPDMPDQIMIPTPTLDDLPVETQGSVKTATPPTSSPLVKHLPPTSSDKAKKPKGKQQQQTTQPQTPGFSMVFSNQSKQLSPAEERQAIIKKESRNLTLHAQREQLTQAMINKDTSTEKHKRALSRVQRELDEERARREALERKLAELTQYQVPEGDLVFESHPTVLRAEKEALQREFVRQVERKKNRLEADLVHTENMRDLERDRVVCELRDKMQAADFLYKRLQDAVKGQSEALKRDVEVVGMLRARVNLLLEDGKFFRDAHEALVAAVDKGKNKELLEKLELQRSEHEVVMVELSLQLMAEAKAEGRRANKSLKEGLPRRRGNAAGPEDTEALLREAQVSEAFAVPNGRTCVVTYTETEVDEERRKALEEATALHTYELVQMEKRMTEANNSFESQLRETVTTMKAQHDELSARMEETEERASAQFMEYQEMAVKVNQLSEELEAYQSAGADGFSPTGRKRSGRRRRQSSRSQSIAASTASGGSTPAQSDDDGDGGQRSPSPRGTEAPDRLSREASPLGATVRLSPKFGRSSMRNSRHGSPHGSPNGLGALQGTLPLGVTFPDDEFVDDAGALTPSMMPPGHRGSSKGSARDGGGGDSWGGSVPTLSAGQSPDDAQHRRRPNLAIPTEDHDAQTDMGVADMDAYEQDEDLQWLQRFGALRSTAQVDHITHELQDSDSIEAIAAVYDVAIADLLTANFIAVPAEPLTAMSDEKLAWTLREINLTIRGIPSRQLTVPVPLGMATAILDAVSVRVAQQQETDELHANVDAATPTNGASGSSSEFMKDLSQTLPVTRDITGALPLPKSPQHARVLLRPHVEALAEVATGLRSEIAALREAVGTTMAEAADTSAWESGFAALVASLRLRPPTPAEAELRIDVSRRSSSMARAGSTTKPKGAARQRNQSVVIDMEPTIIASPPLSEPGEPGESMAIDASHAMDDCIDAVSLPTSPGGDGRSRSFFGTESADSHAGDASVTAAPSPAATSPRGVRRDKSRMPAVLKTVVLAMAPATRTYYTEDKPADKSQAPFGHLKPQRRLHKVAVYDTDRGQQSDNDGVEVSSPPAPTAPVKHMSVWVSADEAPGAKAEKLPDQQHHTTVQKSILFVSGAGHDAAQHALRPRGQTLSHAGAGVAVLVAEQQGRLALVINAHAVFTALYKGFIHRVEILSAGSVLTGNKARSEAPARKKSFKATSAAADASASSESPIMAAPQVVVVARSPFSQLRDEETAETKRAVQERRTQAGDRRTVARELRGETLESRAVEAVRMKRKLQEHLKIRRETEHDVPRQRRLAAAARNVGRYATHARNDPRDDDAADRDDSPHLPRLTAATPPPPQRTMVHATTATANSAVERIMVLPPVALTPEPKPTFPNAVRRQLAQISDVDDRLRAIREKQALDATLLNQHKTAERRRHELALSAHSVGSVVVHPALGEILSAVASPLIRHSAPAKLATTWSHPVVHKKAPSRLAPL
jgi:hypothetical protein